MPAGSIPVRAGSLSSELLAQLPADLLDAYDLGDLLAGDWEDRLVWVVRAGSTYRLGAFVGDAFADAILSGWSSLPSGTADPQA